MSLTLCHSIDEHRNRATSLAKLKRSVEILGGRVAFLSVEKNAIDAQLMGVAEASHEQLTTNSSALGSWMDGQAHDLGSAESSGRSI